MRMQLHDAVRYARMEKRLSQKKLAEMAGIQRRQLATLEKGGNVTLATVRKVLAVLPNLEEFTMDTVKVDVAAQPYKPAIDPHYWAETIQVMATSFDMLSKRLQRGELPTPEDHAALHAANVHLLANLPPEDRAKVLGKKAPEYMDEIDAEIARRVREGREEE